MPTAQKLTKAELGRLSKLPRSRDLVIGGGKRTLAVYLRDGKQTFQPQSILWMDTEQGFIRSVSMVSPIQTKDDGISEALQALVTAFTGPFMPVPAPPPPGILTLDNGKNNKKNNQPQPSLPARVEVNDPELAESARAMLSPLNVPVEYVAEIPAFDEAFEMLAASMGADEDAEPPEPFSWDIDTALLPDLFKAVGGYWKRAPWKYMPDNPPIMLDLGKGNGPQPDTDIIYASIMGGGGIVTGVALYFSLDAYIRTLEAGEEQFVDDEELDSAIEMLRQAGAPIEGVPREELRQIVAQLVVKDDDDDADDEDDEDDEDYIMNMEDSVAMYFDSSDEVDPTYLEWLEERGLKSPSRQGVPSFVRVTKGSEPRNPDAREVKALTLAIEALNQFFTKYQRTLEGPFLPADGLNLQATVGATKQKAGTTVEITFPPPDYNWTDDEFEDDEEGDEEYIEVEGPDDEPTPASLTTLYRFQVKLDSKKSIWRRIEMPAYQTLHDLHDVIQEAFEWDDDHLYAFFMSGKAWDEASEYQSPLGGEGRSAAKMRLEKLKLKPKQSFLYLFDFGDEIRHTVTLEEILPKAVKDDVEYPRIIESQGKAPPQYS